MVHNYLLALQRQDYERARSYLSPTLSGYPADVEQFAADVDRLAADVDRPPYDINWYRVMCRGPCEWAEIAGDAGLSPGEGNELHATRRSTNLAKKLHLLR